MCYKPNLRINGEYRGSLKWNLEKNPKTNSEVEELIKTKKWSIIPCKQCLQCRQTYAENWANRIETENSYYENSHFITLTYDDEHLPVHNLFEDTHYHGLVNPIAYIQGQRIETGSLDFKDLQDFMKRVREHAERKGLAEVGQDGKAEIRYFACGEYGDRSQRPHFHIIIFGLKIPDLKLNYRKNGYEHDTSEWLSKVWGQGIVDIGSVTWNSARYVAQYVIKKQKGQNAKLYEQAGITPEGVRMSLKPGIGYRYWHDHREEIYSQDRMYLSNGRKVRPPQYFDIQEDRLKIKQEQKEIEDYFKDTIDAEELILPKMESDYMRDLKKERRKRANDALFAKLKQTSGTTIVEYYENIGKKYENKHKLALDRSRVDTQKG